MKGRGKPSLDPTPIVELSMAYWGSQTLFTANRIGLFDRLTGKSMTAAEIAADLDLHDRPTGLLLKACVALGFLEMNDNKYSNSQISDMFLVSGSASYMGNALRYGDDMYSVWSRLEDVLKNGRPAIQPEKYLGGEDPERTRRFVYAMHNRALGIGRALVSMVDLSNRRRLLDLGGGPGTYSALFAARYPELSARVMDLPEVVAVADEILGDMGVGDRVKTIAGDYHHTGFPPGQDVVLISGVFHRETEAVCRNLVERAGKCLSPGGLFIVSDVLSDAGGTGPAFATLFGLNMALSADNGGVHADSDVVAWMREAGFESVETRLFPPPMPHRVVQGTKP